MLLQRCLNAGRIKTEVSGGSLAFLVDRYAFDPDQSICKGNLRNENRHEQGNTILS